MPNTTVRFVDLGAQYMRFREDILDIFDSICKTGHYVFGPHLRDFEQKFANYCGTKYALGVANGSDALYLIMKALDLPMGGKSSVTTPGSKMEEAEDDVQLSPQDAYMYRSLVARANFLSQDLADVQYATKEL